MKKAILAVFLSVVLHVILPVVETLAERHGWQTAVIDSVVFYPAKLFGLLMPGGHGIVQLVFPFVFSVAFYASVFWILLIVYERQHRKIAGVGQKGTSSD